MANTNTLTTMAVGLMAVLLWAAIPATMAKGLLPLVEVTLSNDWHYPVWFMCQMTDKADSLHQLPANSTYHFSFYHIAFPMRWCYLYINQRRHGFFWAYTLRSKCSKCFWSIKKNPSLYRGDKGRWERQKLFMPPDFEIEDYLIRDNKPASTSPPQR